MNGVILVGRRPDGGHRDELWRWCDRRWTHLLDWPVHAGLHTAGDREEFCLSVASNRAARAATDWDVAVYVGGDWLAGTGGQVQEAAERSLALGQLVFAHDRTVVMNEEATARVLAEPTSHVGDWPLPAMPRGGPYDEQYGTVHPTTFSGVLAVPRDLWQRVGGFDERFIGWGWDDLAFWSACCAVGGGFSRVENAAIYHLWHPQVRAVREEQPHHGANQVLGERYLAAKWNRDAMLGILREPGGPLA